MPLVGLTESKLLLSKQLGGPVSAAAAFLLDTYTNAAFAYSFRKLRTAYAGNAVRIRESGGNTEQDFGFDGSGNFDAAGAATFIGANTGYIVKWYDQSGNGLDVVQSTAGSQPTYTASGIGSKPSITFAGSYGMGTASSIDLSTYISTNGTAFIILNQDGSQTYNVCAQWQPINPDNRFAIIASFANVLYWDFGSNSAGRVSVAQPTGWDNTNHILECYRDASDKQGITVDGINLIETSGVTQDIASQSGVFTVAVDPVGDSPFKGLLSELVGWGTDLGATNRAAARGAINTYYSVF